MRRPDPFETPDPLALLLLPEPLERFAHAEHARDLLRAPRVLALEPPRVSWQRLARMPETVRLAVGVRQARRLKLPGDARVVILYDALQLPLAQGLLLRHDDAQLWRAEHVEEASAQATFAFDPAGPDPSGATAFDRNEPLWARLEQLGVATFER